MMDNLGLTSSQEEVLGLNDYETAYDITAMLSGFDGDVHDVIEGTFSQPTEQFEQKPYMGLTSEIDALLPHAPVFIPQTTSTGLLPSTEDYEGDYQFEILLQDISSGKQWLYSPPLHKVFINIGNRFPVLFKWKPGAESELYVRALPVFMLPEYVQDPVTRCLHHAIKSPNSGFVDLKDHVVLSDNTCAVYYTDPASQRFSVVVPLERPQEGDDFFPCMYTFMCKNSCTSGMNRRATQLVFTLEDANGKVLGRRSLQFRVCSCPKRDKDKEEEDLRRRNLNVANNEEGAPKQGKRTKTSTASNTKKMKVSDNTYTVKVLGEDAHQHLLKEAHGFLLRRASMEERTLTEKEEALIAEYKASVVE